MGAWIYGEHLAPVMMLVLMLITKREANATKATEDADGNKSYYIK